MKTLNAKGLLSLVLALVMLLSLGLTGCTPTTNTTGGASTTGPNTDDETTAPDVDPTEPSAPEGTELYTFTVKSVGAKPVANVAVTVTGKNGTEVASGTTDENGKFSTYLVPDVYTATAENTTVTTTEDSRDFEIAVVGVITEYYPNQPAKYNIGDVFYDFAFLNADGEEVKLSELLQSKKLVIINFWATWCSPCKNEFPAIQKAYEMFGDDVEIVAFSTYDDASKCDEFRETNGYTFTMAPDVGLYSRFSSVHGGASIPCTIFVDRYGMIAYGMTGGSSNVNDWIDIMEKFTSDNYSPDMDFDNDDNKDDEKEQIKPDVEMPDSADIENVINGTNSNGNKFNGKYYTSEDEYVWPWILTENGTAIEPSNYGIDSTTAMINMDLTFEKNQVFAFDFEYSIDYDKYGTQIYDFLAVYVDGHAIQTLYTKQNGKTTCYAYVPAEAGEHTVTIVYYKDDSTWELMEAGNEYVHVNNLRLVSVEDMVANGGSVNVWTPAADTPAAKDAATEYENYVDVVLAEDGYYHVGTADGPLLLTKLYGSSQWSSSSLYALGYNGYLKIDGVNYYNKLAGSEEEGTTKTYLWLEQNSDLGYTPVDADLADLLDLFAENIGDGKNHEKEWLEFCCYFVHYGEGEGITKVTDVRQGIDFVSAFDAVEGKNHVYVNRTLVPRGVYFKFVPEKSGVYKFYSLAEGVETSGSVSEVDTVGWLFNADGDLIDESPEGVGGHFTVLENLVAGETYYIAVAFDDTETLGQFDFMIEFVNDEPTPDMDVMTDCTGGYTTDLETGEMYIYRMYGVEVALGTDGYYHQVLGYEKDGTPILDISEHGYIYIDFLNTSELLSFIPYVGEYCTLKSYITKGYYQEDANGQPVCDENGKAILYKDAFDFTKRTDSAGNSLEELGNHQAAMEAYLELALSGNETDFDYGYVKADEALVEIINVLLRLYGEGCEDEWLLAASFARHP